jgi:hypothetical protein
MPDGHANETAPRQVTVREVHAEFEKVLRSRTHMGVRNFLGDACLEPRNPFQATRRRPKKWVVAAAGILLLALVIVYGFQVR